MSAFFPGSSYLSNATGLGAPSALSCFCWYELVKGDPTFGGGALMGNWGSGGSQNFTIEAATAIPANDASLSIIDNGSTGHGASHLGEAKYGRWNSIGAVFSSTVGLRAYSNGARSALTAGSFTLQSSSDPTCVGGRNDALRLPIGFIEHAAFWTATLTHEEMLALANGALPKTIRPGSLWAYWPLTREYGFKDISGNARHLTVASGRVNIADNTPFVRKNPILAKISDVQPAISGTFISSHTALYTPTVLGSGTATITAPFISSHTTLYTPVVANVLKALPPFISSHTTLYTPTVTPTGSAPVAAPFISSHTSLYTPGFAYDITPPVLQSIWFIQSTPIVVVLTYNEALDIASVPVAGDFAVTVNGVSTPVTLVNVRGYTILLEL